VRVFCDDGGAMVSLDFFEIFNEADFFPDGVLFPPLHKVEELIFCDGTFASIGVFNDGSKFDLSFNFVVEGK
jgi:hypothetical protein